MEQCEYVTRLLEAYRATPGTAGVVRRVLTAFLRLSCMTAACL
jgi:hypothetical protein